MAGKKITCLSCGQTNAVPFDKLAAGPKCGTCKAPLMPDAPVDVDLATLVKAAQTDDVPLVVDFWAPWCGPCKMMGPEFAKAANALKGQARLIKLDTQKHQSAGQRYGIRGIPTMVAFKGGREVKRQSGAVSAGAITDWVKGL
ncbi:MAG: thioredoxin [Thalassobium sp.]|uniref:thioredoxin n=1 Tax=Octadecabacter sp. SW4 TaxID=2602067 RepID=UPI000C0ED626|nr:thioredoxin [Octadecabacter sp. SW4]PHQ82983.1 MAG: thioredoxin [Thalassobium sp.]QEE34838.1 thioredoxin [Octadecabacter sp. SW4]